MFVTWLLPIALFHFLNKLVNIEFSTRVLDELLYGVLTAVNIKQCTNDNRQSFWIDFADEDFDGFHLITSVKGENEVVYHVVAVTNDYQWQLK